MGVYSLTNQGRMMVWKGNLADFIADGRKWTKNSILSPNDLPGTFYIGDGNSTFLQLSSIGKTERPVATALNTTAAATAAAMLNAIAGGLITSTSAAAVSLVLPTAAQLAAKFGGVKGVSLEFTVDNTGPNTVTISMATGITVQTPVITGADTMTVLTTKVGRFRIYFVSNTVATITRVS